MASVATGAAKLTKLSCIRANRLSPVRPNGFSNGAVTFTIFASTPTDSRYFMITIITTMTGISV